MDAKQRKMLNKTFQSSNYSNKFGTLLIVSLRKTFFDIIDERIPFTSSLNSNFISTVSVADGNIITTSKWTNFNLFAFEYSWTERVVKFRGHDSTHENLVTVRQIKSKR